MAGAAEAARAHAAGWRAALTDLQVHVSNSVSALTVTQEALAQAQDRIDGMEQSLFWRLRERLVPPRGRRAFVI